MLKKGHIGTDPAAQAQAIEDTKIQEAKNNEDTGKKK